MSNLTNYYDDILKYIYELRQSYTESSTNKDLLKDTEEYKEIEKANEDFLKFLDKFTQNTHKDIELLKKNANWDRFMIGFYGETNAGKSTIIETLRILFDESTKKLQREEFASKTKEIQSKNDDIKDIKAKCDSKCQQISKNIETINKELETLLKRNFFYKIYKYFTIRSLKQAIQKNKKQIDSIVSDNNKIIENIAQEIRILQDELKELQDGAIIGDGRPDFTKKCQNYDLKINDSDITLIDIPGIEGSEQKVEDEIFEAISKAHAVFFISSEIKRPQKGDGINPGTIDKIKAHLGKQSEVYTIFNKKLQKPTHKFQLDNKGQTAIDDVDSYMKALLDDSYKKSFYLSALPVFLAFGNIVESNDKYKNKQMFLSHFKDEEILSFYNFADFCNFLKNDFIADYQKKIKISNLKKVLETIKELKENIKNNIDKQKDCEDKLKNLAQNTKEILNKDVERYQMSLQNELAKILDAEKKELRKDIYEFIEHDKKDKEIKTRLKNKLENLVKEVLPRKFENVQNRKKEELAKQIEEDLKDFENKVQGIRKHFSNINIKDQFGKSIKIDTGISGWNIAGIATSIGVGIYGIVNFWNPTGWIAWATLIASIGSALLGVINAGLDLFRSKESIRNRQKSQSDEYIDDVFYDIKGQIYNNAKTINLDEISKKLFIPYNIQKQKIENISKTIFSIEKLQTKTEEEIKNV